MAEQISNINSFPSKIFSNSKLMIIIFAVIVAGLGAFSGYLINNKKNTTSELTGEIPKEKIIKGSEFGAKDSSSFKDTAIGVLGKNGVEGEGTHRLAREGGPSQTVYMTSSVLDLDQFVGQKIQVWGETYRAQKVGWLMDIGKVKILE